MTSYPPYETDSLDVFISGRCHGCKVMTPSTLLRPLKNRYGRIHRYCPPCYAVEVNATTQEGS